MKKLFVIVLLITSVFFTPVLSAYADNKINSKAVLSADGVKNNGKAVMDEEDNGKILLAGILNNKTKPVSKPVSKTTETNAESSFTPITGWDMMKKMGIGINIGNTLEASGKAGAHQGLESETLWGAEKIEKWQFEAIKLKGIDSVRIPVTWGNHMDLKTRKIDEKWMARVQECVDMALDAGLIVVINTHHEHFLYDFMICDDGEYGDFDGAAKWLDDVWKQIADRFKDYPETLIFEPMNEPSPGGSKGPGWYWDHVGQKAQRERLCELVNKLNRHVLKTIRNSGGNNDKRIVVNAITQADAKLVDKYKHTFDDPYTMLGIFFYTGDEQIQFRQIEDAIKKEIPIILKETLPIGIEEQDRSENWAKKWYPELGKLGAVPMWWNCYGTPPGDFFNRWSGWWNDSMINIVFNAYGKKPGLSMEPPAEMIMESIFSDNGFDKESGIYWFGGSKLRDAMVDNKYLIIEMDTDELMFIVHSGANGYTKNEVEGTRIEGTNLWYIETKDPISNHLGSFEEIGWWFQIQLICQMNTNNGTPKAMVSNTLPQN